MGYTHYWTQERSFTDDEWSEVTADIGEILSYVENLKGVPLAGPEGDAGTRPMFDNAEIMFNGVGDDAHETFTISRVRRKAWSGGRLGSDFCKTARKPYDAAVVACLCYLASVTETHSVASDGNGHNFVEGLAVAREAIPRKANVIDIPMPIMEDDRWTGPWVSGQDGSGYEVCFCIDGKGYVQKLATQEWYCFDSHAALGRFLEAHKHAVFARNTRTPYADYSRVENDIWGATGVFDKARHARIAKSQAKALAPLFPPDAEHAVKPPAYVRPGDMPRPEDGGTFCYSLSDLIARCDKEGTPQGIGISRD